MNNDKITVILPVYNAMPYLPDAIDSILRQTYENFVLYIINNGSTDQSEDYVKSLRDNRIVYFNLGKANLVKALNLGLRNSNTEYIARMDADDISDIHRFEKQIHFLKGNPEIGIVGTQGKYFGNIDKRTVSINLPYTNEEIINSMLQSKHAIIHASVMMRLNLLRGQLYNEDYFPCEDFEFFLRLSANVKFSNLEEELYFFRIHEKSINASKIKESLIKYYYISAKYSKRGKNKIKNYIYHFDIKSMVIYRKGLYYYLNKNAIFGIFYFFLASIISPMRLLNFLKYKFLRIKNNV
jgi:glycosyltransferase involved in cell wall biosynthesis